jgi:hypothetical protein
VARGLRHSQFHCGGSSSLASSAALAYIRSCIVTRAVSLSTHLLQEVLLLLWVSKTLTPPLHLQLDGMVERYIKTVEEHLRKVVASHQRDWDRNHSSFS